MEAGEPIPFARTALALACAIALVSVVVAVTRAPSPAGPAAAGEMADPTVGLTRQIEARPEDGEAWRMLGLLRGSQGQYRAAAAAFGQAARRLPRDADLRSSLGEALTLAASGKVTPEADAAFRSALSLDRAEPRARFYLGVEKEQAGDRAGAAADWRALLATAPKDAAWRPLVQQALNRASR